MASPAVGEVFRVTFFCRATDQLAVNVRYFKCGGIVGLTPTETQVANQMDTVFAPLYKALLSANADYKGMQIQMIGPGPSRIPIFVNASVGAGAVAGNVMARQASGIATFKTALAGRANRGRIYVPFPSVADDTALGHPSAGYLTNLTALADAMTNSQFYGPAGSQIQADWSIKHAGGLTTQFILTNRANPKWATQKRRGDYGKPNPV